MPKCLRQFRTNTLLPGCGHVLPTNPSDDGQTNLPTALLPPHAPHFVMVRNIPSKSLNLLEKSPRPRKSPRFSMGLFARLAAAAVASVAKTTLKIERVATFCVVTQDSLTMP
jgi:hypothetical protein